MLGYPVITQGAKFSNVTTTSDADDHHQRDKGSDERKGDFYPVHSALSVNTTGSRFCRLTMLFGHAQAS